MTYRPFEPDVDLAPIPFDERICQLALDLKGKGLKWRPHVGCFVWDPDGFIQAPSPFPNRIYFILSMTRFTEIFGSEEKMVETLVWLPTWHQGHIICRKLGLRGNRPADNMVAMYQQIGTALSVKHQNEVICDLAVKAELGDISDLPPELISHTRLVYRQFVGAYLDMLRQKENKPADWFPAQWSLDLNLADDMRHFYSDHQFITRKFLLLKAGIRQLREIDRDRRPSVYQRAVDDLLQRRRLNILAEI